MNRRERIIHAADEIQAEPACQTACETKERVVPAPNGEAGRCGAGTSADAPLEPTEELGVTETHRRRLIGYHLTYLVLSAGVLAMASWMSSRGPKEVFLPGMEIALPELCMSQRCFGLPCPGCGMTRSFISIAHGQWERAWNFNPASYLVFVFIVAQIPWRLGQIWRVHRGLSEWETRWVAIPVAVMGAALFLQWLIRLLS